MFKALSIRSYLERHPPNPPTQRTAFGRCCPPRRQAVMTTTPTARAAAAIGSLMIICGPFLPSTKHTFHGRVHLQSYWNDAAGDSLLLIALGMACLVAAMLDRRKACRAIALATVLLVSLGSMSALAFSSGTSPDGAYSTGFAWGMYVTLSGIAMLAIATLLLRKRSGQPNHHAHSASSLAAAGARSTP